MRRVWRNNGLPIVLAATFTFALDGQGVVGHR
jgi:hypothetical protein